MAATERNDPVIPINETSVSCTKQGLLLTHFEHLIPCRPLSPAIIHPPVLCCVCCFYPHFPSFCLPSFCSILTSPLWLDFSPFILITHFVLPYSPALHSVPLLPAPVSRISACLFPSLQVPVFPASSSPLLGPFFTLLSSFSLSTGTHDPLPSYLFHPSFSLLFFVARLDSLSFNTMNPEGFIFSSLMALPLSLIPHLHQLPSCSLCLSPLCFPSFFCSIAFTLTFCVVFFMLYSTPLIPPHPLHISISQTPWHAIPLLSLSGHSSFFYWFHLSPSSLYLFSSLCTQQIHILMLTDRHSNHQQIRSATP